MFFSPTGAAWSFAAGEDRCSVGHLGMDVHHPPSPLWRSDFIAAPDLAQVESDPEGVSLSRYSLHFP
jgi:hypothetical protein